MVPAVDRRCFNGAAVRGRRKDGATADIDVVLTRASMGPPSEDDGKSMTRRIFASSTNPWLQWGRRPRRGRRKAVHSATGHQTK